MELVKVDNVTKKFGNFKALDNLSISFEAKKQYAIVGSSGSGKSTLLYLMGGLDKPHSGEIFVEGKSLSKMNDKDLAHYRNTKVGFVFQFHFLLPSINCLENILLPAQIGNTLDKKIEHRAKELADHLGVMHCLVKYPHELSGGEQQRINVIRALSLKPRMLLCDEPTGNLDSVNSIKVTKLLKDLAREFEATLAIVTHDLEVAKSFDHQYHLQDGHLIQ